MVESLSSSEHSPAAADEDGASGGSERERVARAHAVLRAQRSGGWSAEHWAAEDELFELVERAVGLYFDDFLSLRAVGEQLGRSVWWVQQRFADIGVRVRAAQERSPTDPAVVAEVVALYGEGLGLVEIATRFGRSTQWVRKCLDEAGIERRRRAVPAVEELVQLYCVELVSVKEIAQRFGRSTGWVRIRLRDAGVEIRHGTKPPPTDPAVLERIVAMYNDGFGLSRIAKEMGRSWGWVKSRLAEAGIEVPPRATSPKAEVDELVRLYVEEGLNMSAIARVVGHSAPWVRSRLVAAGVEIRRPQPLTGEKKQMIIESYSHTEGASIPKIAAQVGVSAAQARRVLRSAGLIEPATTAAPAVDPGRIRELFESSALTLSEIAQQLDYPTAAVEAVVRRAGLVKRDNGNRLEITARQLLAHLEAGLDIDAIADRYDVTPTAVDELIERHRVSAP